MLFLGFDAGNPALVRRWAADGHLPHFARLLTDGASSTVEHEPGLYVGSIWPTAMTGVGVDRHGFYTGIRPAPFSYGYVPAGVDATPFWVDVARSGRRIATVDVPFFPAVSELDGVQIVEWGCHDRYYGPHSEPPDVLEQLVADVGLHTLGMIDHELGYERFAPCDWVHLTDGTRGPDQVVAFVERLDGAIDQRRRLLDHLGTYGPLDLHVEVVGESHCAGHHLWSLHDSDHPDHDQALADRLGGDPLLAAYRRFDELLGAHLNRLGEHDTAYVFLSHGMRAHHDGTHLFDEVLWRLDCAYRGLPEPWRGSSTRRAGELLRWIPKPARRATLGAMAPALRRRVGAGVGPTPVSEVPGPAERLWSPLENNTVTGAIRFNRVGREPSGLLAEPLVAHAAEWLRERLCEIVNLDDGGPVIEEVYPSDRHYRRRSDDGLPDVLVEWRRDRPIERIWSPVIGTVVRPYDGVRTGDHDEWGELLALGPGIEAGRKGEIAPVDIAPTVAAAAGVYLHDRDGRPVAALLPTPQRASGLDAPVANLDRSIPARVRRPVEGADDAAAMRRDLIDLRHQLRGLEAAHHETRQIADAARSTSATALDVLATTSWIRRQPVDESLKVSVVTPTCGRLDQLRLAVASVLDQTYENLELVVVDDCSDDGTNGWLTGLDDHRVVAVRNERRLGEGGSRNRALDLVTGDVVVFLDDDNSFEPDWLRSVAWLFGEQPDTEIAYGARIVDDRLRHHGSDRRGMPWLQLNEWDRETNSERCLIDVNTIAHRPGPVRFDPTLPVFTDWDYLLGLTLDADPVRLPVVATRYTTSAPDRATTVYADQTDQLYARVRAKWQSRG